MDIAIWLNIPDWLLAGSCVVSEHGFWLGDSLGISLHLIGY